MQIKGVQQGLPIPDNVASIIGNQPLHLHDIVTSRENYAVTRIVATFYVDIQNQETIRNFAQYELRPVV